jgi:hypothetical protein
MRVVRLVVGIAFVLVVSGCTQEGQANQGTQVASPARSPLPPVSSPSVVPAPDVIDDSAADAPTMIVVRSFGLEVVDSSGGAVATVGYFDAVEGVVEALTHAVGEPPNVDRYPGNLEQSPGTSFTWDGLTVLDSDVTAQHPVTPEWSVLVVGDRAGALPVSTADVVAVGLPQAQVEARVPGALIVPAGDQHDQLWGFTEETRAGYSSTSGDSITHSVCVSLQGPPFVVTSLSAPSINRSN